LKTHFDEHSGSKKAIQYAGDGCVISENATKYIKPAGFLSSLSFLLFIVCFLLFFCVEKELQYEAMHLFEGKFSWIYRARKSYSPFYSRQYCTSIKKKKAETKLTVRVA
jgi:hypothetical protein